MSHILVNDKVRFGRPNGEKTVGIVEKINRKAVKVRTLEDRGTRTAAGQIWRVSPMLIEVIERNGKPVSIMPTKAASPSSGAGSIVERAMSKLTTQEIKALSDYFRQGYIDSRLF